MELAQTRNVLDWQEKDEADRRRKVQVGAFLGTAIEYYDFTLYGLLGPIYFGRLFFPQSNPTTALIAVLSIYAVGFFGRPVGGIVFSHFGDRFVRKPVMVVTMTLMGVTSALIGLLPTYESAGVWAAVMLLVLRTVQGFALGGESAGANVLSSEVSKPGERGFFTSLTTVGIFFAWVFALIASQLVALLPQPEAFAWGWRVPFLASLALVALGIWMRLKVMESPVFVEAMARGGPVRVPFLTLMKVAKRPSLIVVLAAAAESANGFFTLVFGFSYALNALHIPASTLLPALLLGNILAIVVTPLAGALSDRVGRRVTLAGVYSASILFTALLFFPLLRSGNTVLIYIGMIIPSGLLSGISIGTVASFYSEQFTDARLRYSGVGFGRGLGTTLGGGLMPIIATALMSVTGGSTIGPIAWFSVVLGSAVIAILCARETKDDRLS